MHNPAAISAPARRRSPTRHRPPARPRAGLALEAALLTFVLALAVYGAARWVHPVWSLLAAANYLWLCTVMCRIEPRGTILVLPQLVGTASSMVALIMIEYGGEMFELGVVGQPGPWSNALNLYNAAFCAGVVFAVRPLIRMLDRRGADALSPILDRYANAIAAIVLALAAFLALALVLRGLQSGFPLLAGTDRFLFRRFAADKVTLYALNLKFVIGYALGFVVFVIPASRRRRVGAAVAFAAMMALYFLFGDKFFTQLAALSAFLAPYLYRNYRQLGRRIWLYAAIALAAFATVLTMTVYIYSNGFAETSAATTKRLSGRMVGQGELWFLQARIGAPLLTWNGPLLERNAAAFSVKAVDLFAAQNSLGAHHFSNRYAPDYLRASLQRNAGSVTYTAVTEAMGLVLFGWIGCALMMALLGMLVGFACAYLAVAIENRSLLSAVFAAYIYTQLRSSIVQATPWSIAGVYSLRWLAVILVIELALLVLGRGSTASARGRFARRRATPVRQRPKPAV